ncbi:hypothetical protein H6798_01210 [Candidatus Nomurabacteria bacterium]|nr:hypothetical protein [Candidatus Nomurabacteria bacterium]
MIVAANLVGGIVIAKHIAGTPEWMIILASVMPAGMALLGLIVVISPQEKLWLGVWLSLWGTAGSLWVSRLAWPTEYWPSQDAREIAFGIVGICWLVFLLVLALGVYVRRHPN